MNASAAAYVGRFAPSPTGPLHAGSLVAALASWLDARAHGGTWLVRIEDIDSPRCVPGADRLILTQLATCGLLPDASPVWQSQRGARYAQALERLIAQGQAYGCACTRADIARAHEAAGVRKEKHGELVYPGTCRPNAQGAQAGLQGRTPRAWRLLVPPGDAGLIHWRDRRLGPQSQALDTAVGDFVVKRADGLWAYQLAVVVDDAAQGITHIVRGEDLAEGWKRGMGGERTSKQKRMESCVQCVDAGLTNPVLNARRQTTAVRSTRELTGRQDTSQHARGEEALSCHQSPLFC